jgi:HK97 family phage major capsid protein
MSTRLTKWQRHALAARGLRPGVYNKVMDKTVPTDPAELEALLADRDKVNAAIADGSFQNVIANYTRAVNQADKTILEQVKDQTNAVLAEFLKNNPEDAKAAKRLNLDPYNGPRHNRYNPVKNPKAVGAKLDGMFPDLATYMQAAWHHGNPDDATSAKLREIKNYQEAIGEQGGFLVPEEFRGELAALSLGDSIVRPRARVIPMSGPTLRFPKIDETSRVSSVYGGVVVYRTEEGAELNESEASFGSIKLEATKQTGLAHVTNELVRDWGAFTAFIEQIFPEAMGFYEDVDFLSANGAGAPLGALAAANGAIIPIAKETNQVAATIVWQNVIRMYARMLPSSINRAVWLASPDTFVELATMALNVGTGGSAIWLTDGVNAPQLTLLGRPVIMTEKAPAALGTQGDLSFVDFGMYLIGDRQMMTVDSSPHVKFTSDKTTFRIIARNDGRPWVESAITPKNNSATLSPFVQLATRA